MDLVKVAGNFGGSFSHNGTQAVIEIPDRKPVVDQVNKQSLINAIEQNDPQEIGRALMITTVDTVEFTCEGNGAIFEKAAVLAYLKA